MEQDVQKGTPSWVRFATWGAMPAKVLIRHAKSEHHGFMLIAWGAMPHLSANAKARTSHPCEFLGRQPKDSYC